MIKYSVTGPNFRPSRDLPSELNFCSRAAAAQTQRWTEFLCYATAAESTATQLALWAALGQQHYGQHCEQHYGQHRGSSTMGSTVGSTVDSTVRQHYGQ